ncbi:sigma-70 family RNA polymerase sigma factor [Brevundimonas faecalis]|uniref:sigma-70 family RNA polymerase sigma factor n=1 Tax=Brevundimonas faecalis TaxID=947378 RepID=UPI00361F8497
MPPPSSRSLELYQAHRQALIDYACGIVGDRSSAEDIVQEAWIRVEAVERLRPPTEPLGYLYRTVRNLALDVYRARRRMGRRSAEELIDQGLQPADDAPSPEAAALARSDLARLLESLDELPDRTRQAVILYKVEGLKLREVAARLKVSVALAQTLVVDGVEHCALRLSREERT